MCIDMQGQGNCIIFRKLDLVYNMQFTLVYEYMRIWFLK